MKFVKLLPIKENKQIILCEDGTIVREGKFIDPKDPEHYELFCKFVSHFLVHYSQLNNEQS